MIRRQASSRLRTAVTRLLEIDLAHHARLRRVADPVVVGAQQNFIALGTQPDQAQLAVDGIGCVPPVCGASFARIHIDLLPIKCDQTGRRCRVDTGVDAGACRRWEQASKLGTFDRTDGGFGCPCSGLFLLGDTGRLRQHHAPQRAWQQHGGDQKRHQDDTGR